MCGVKRYVTNVCMYAALFRLYSGTITQTARRRESVPLVQDTTALEATDTSCFKSSVHSAFYLDCTGLATRLPHGPSPLGMESIGEVSSAAFFSYLEASAYLPVPHTHSSCTTRHKPGSSRPRATRCLKTATPATPLLTLHTRPVPGPPLKPRTGASTLSATATRCPPPPPTVLSMEGHPFPRVGVMDSHTLCVAPRVVLACCGTPGRAVPRGGGGAPNSWVCGPGVIRQFAPPLPTIEGRVSSTWVLPATLGTSGGWAPEAAMGLELPCHKTCIHTYKYRHICINI